MHIIYVYTLKYLLSLKITEFIFQNVIGMLVPGLSIFLETLKKLQRITGLMTTKWIAFK